MRQGELSALEVSLKTSALQISKELRAFYKEHYKDYGEGTLAGSQFDMLLRLIEYISTLRANEVPAQIRVVLDHGGAEGYKNFLMENLRALTASDSATLARIMPRAEKVFLDYGRLMEGILQLRQNPSPPPPPPPPAAGSAPAPEDDKVDRPFNKFT